MNWGWKLVAAGVTWLGVTYVLRRRSRIALYERAAAAALKRGKPLLVVGAPDEWSRITAASGGATTEFWPKAQSDDVCYHGGLPFKDRQFGAAIAMWALEFCENPTESLNELRRVADEVFVLHSALYDPLAWLSPGAKWVLLSADNQGVSALKHPLGGTTSAVALSGAVLGGLVLGPFGAITGGLAAGGIAKGLSTGGGGRSLAKGEGGHGLPDVAR